MTQSVDYLLVGHGLAGATLAAVLRQRGRRVLVLDPGLPDTASSVAAGLLNPVAGKRLALGWRMAELLPAAVAYYRQQEQDLGQEFLRLLPIRKLFSSVADQNDAMARSADRPWQDFVAEISPELPPLAGVRQTFGGMLIAGGYLRVRELLAAQTAAGLREGWLRQETFDPGLLVIGPAGVTYGDSVLAAHVVFCEGAAARHNPWFNWLPLTPNQGEVLDVECPGLAETEVLNKGAYVVPLGNGRFRVGATYRWPPFATGTTAEALAELSQRLADITDLPFTVVQQWAAVRPATRDRKPLLGTHPALPSLSICNGFGSKGVLMAPRLAGHFADVLEGTAELWAEVNIRRYFSLYPAVAPATAVSS
ncbi:NAD(P)/FAD-dependent oxidoreductase [Hymenobacter guriensis]|uniref:FAD-dependent oxidoreductase n=1 Tax=Hymenobacter guriensis TaxID=2793065 RepID=A0ABS0L2E9_9BACT|nr:FAD-dependent oxidoreductase [Hymenobacter guriensis]MBG8554269.1 FAD-dependent oxidoreductase [Hymenobacter guriensis]